MISPFPFDLISQINSSDFRSNFISLNSNPDIIEWIYSFPDLSTLIIVYKISSICKHLIVFSCPYKMNLGVVYIYNPCLSDW